MKTQWPLLSYAKGKETYETIHLWTQVIGKIKLAKIPWINHSWHITLFVTPTGLTSEDIPDGDKHFHISLNFLMHQLRLETSTGQVRTFGLPGLSVADFYHKLMESLQEFNIQAEINPIPCELEDPEPLNTDQTHKTYDTAQATALHHALLRTHDVFTRFRAGFLGKCSPVHFFWGSFDLAVTRFSGRTAPEHPGGIPHMPDWVAREAYSHEVSSCGFWPGNEAVPFAAFYSYAYPQPEGFKNSTVKPQEAFFHEELGEFMLPYDAVQKADDPEAVLLQFLESTYMAAAGLANWDRKALEVQFPDRRTAAR